MVQPGNFEAGAQGFIRIFHSQGYRASDKKIGKIAGGWNFNFSLTRKPPNKMVCGMLITLKC